MNTTAETTNASIAAAQEQAASVWECTDNGYQREQCRHTNRHTGHNFQVYRNSSTQYRWCRGN